MLNARTFFEVESKLRNKGPPGEISAREGFLDREPLELLLRNNSKAVTLRKCDHPQRYLCEPVGGHNS